MNGQGNVLEVGTVLEGRYRLISEGLSQDLGTLYKAYDIQYDRLVAVLVLPTQVGVGSQALEHLARTQRAVAGLAQPGLIPFEHVGQVQGQTYLVRSHMEGQPLADLLARSGRLEIGDAVEIAVRLCETLAPAHRAGIVHGNLSSHSLVVRAGGDGPDAPRWFVAVTDAGLLSALPPVLVQPGRTWGRSPYFSPEQAAGEAVHPASDVYVIGCLLYEMLAGRPPFRTGDQTILVMQHLRQDPPALQILVPQIPTPLAQIVHKALSKEPSARYRNAGQLAHILRAQIGSPLTSEPAKPAAQQVPARERLVVPAPPPAAPVAQLAGEAYYAGWEEDGWAEEPAGVDWLMVGLLVAALVAVLGLIPLWRAVYRRYAVPAPVPPAGRYYPLERGTALDLLDGGLWLSETVGRAGLDGYGIVWYNEVSPSAGVNGGSVQNAVLSDRSQVAVDVPVWESSLRVLETNCITMCGQQVVEA